MGRCRMGGSLPLQLANKCTLQRPIWYCLCLCLVIEWWRINNSWRHSTKTKTNHKHTTTPHYLPVIILHKQTTMTILRQSVALQLLVKNSILPGDASTTSRNWSFPRQAFPPNSNFFTLSAMKSRQLRQQTYSMPIRRIRRPWRTQTRYHRRLWRRYWANGAEPTPKPKICCLWSHSNKIRHSQAWNPKNCFH